MAKGKSSKSSMMVAAEPAAGKVVRTALPREPRTEADVARKAFEIYEREGRPVGRHLDHWLLARAELGLA
jgi:hypothetical protein